MGHAMIDPDEEEQDEAFCLCPDGPGICHCPYCTGATE